MKDKLKNIIPQALMDLYYAFWPILGNIIYKNPSSKIKVVGVTGTNGKTSVTHIATNLLEASGIKVASISTFRFKIGDKEWPNTFKMTMPGRMHIQKFLRRAVDERCEVVIMEVTSEGVLQKRHLGIKFDTAVFTNLTPEHIERHGSMEAYRAAKGEFFVRPHKTAIINADDKENEYFANLSKGNIIYYSQKEIVKNIKDLLRARNAVASETGISFELEDIKFNSSLLGAFNIDNSLAAIGVCVSFGIDIKTIAENFKKVKPIPGRAEVVMTRPNVVVDYAHTPDGLEKLYDMANSVKKSNGKTICVLGSAGGGRDRWKRPKMGTIAADNCDKIILTDEDPYEENPFNIIKDIQKGITDEGKTEVIIDRRKAIAKALSIAEQEDTVIVSGKGAEPLMMLANGKKLEWDDRKVVKQEWQKLQK